MRRHIIGISTQGHEFRGLSPGADFRSCPQAPGLASVDSARPPSKRYCNTSWASHRTSTSWPKSAKTRSRPCPRLVASAICHDAQLGGADRRRPQRALAASSAYYRHSLLRGEEDLAGPVLLRLSSAYGRYRKPFIYPIGFIFSILVESILSSLAFYAPHCTFTAIRCCSQHLF